MEKYYIVTLDNVIKNNYVQADNTLPNIIPSLKFPILAEETKIDGEYTDLITNELIVDPLISSTKSHLHCVGVTLIDPRYCKLFLSKLTDEAVENYFLAINKIKEYTRIQTQIDEQIAKQNQKSEEFIKQFKSKYRKNSSSN